VRELGEGVSLLRALKRAFDPNGIMNPGALVDA
jgi:FAD/FMN-containing dehydrogenase